MENFKILYAHPVGKVMGNIWSAARNECLSKEVNMAMYKSMILHTVLYECWKYQKKYNSILSAVENKIHKKCASIQKEVQLGMNE